MMRLFQLFLCSSLASGVLGQASPSPSPSPSTSTSTSTSCISVANSIASISPTYAAALLQNADAIGLQAYQLAQPEPGVLIQKTFLVPEETDFANFYIFLYRRYTFQAATTTLKALIALQTLPSLHTAANLSSNGTVQTNLTGYSLLTSGISITGPCAPGDLENIGNERCFANITRPDVGACQSIIQGISNLLAPPYWMAGDLAGVLWETPAPRAPLVTPACSMGKQNCESRVPGQEISTDPPICDATCSVSLCCQEL